MVNTLDDRKKALINKVDEIYGDEAKLVCFNDVDNNRIALWFLRYLDNGDPSHGACAEEKEKTCTPQI